MFEHEISLYAFMHRYGSALVADIADEDFCDQPAPGINHPAWEIGHLTVSAQVLLAAFGGEAVVDERWSELFDRGTTPLPDPSLYPTKDELLESWGLVHVLVTKLVAGLTEQQTNQPNPLAEMREMWPKVGQVISHVMTTHEAMHLGQLTVWRKLTGRGRVVNQ